jgi:hypothetical protein
VKPLIWKGAKYWTCWGGAVIGVGDTPALAYSDWACNLLELMG